jgi:hypothetical protein
VDQHRVHHDHVERLVLEREVPGVRHLEGEVLHITSPVGRTRDQRRRQVGADDARHACTSCQDPGQHTRSAADLQHPGVWREGDVSKELLAHRPLLGIGATSLEDLSETLLGRRIELSDPGPHVRHRHVLPPASLPTMATRRARPPQPAKALRSRDVERPGRAAVDPTRVPSASRRTSQESGEDWRRRRLAEDRGFEPLRAVNPTRFPSQGSAVLGCSPAFAERESDVREQLRTGSDEDN